MNDHNLVAKDKENARTPPPPNYHFPPVDCLKSQGNHASVARLKPRSGGGVSGWLWGYNGRGGSGAITDEKLVGCGTAAFTLNIEHTPSHSVRFSAQGSGERDEVWRAPAAIRRSTC